MRTSEWIKKTSISLIHYQRCSTKFNLMIYLYRPYLPEEAIKKLVTFEKHQLIYGENCKNFESEFSKYL